MEVEKPALQEARAEVIAAYEKLQEFGIPTFMAGGKIYPESYVEPFRAFEAAAGELDAIEHPSIDIQPQDGEWWMCRHRASLHQEPMMKSAAGWVTGSCVTIDGKAFYQNCKPIYRMGEASAFNLCC